LSDDGVESADPVALGLTYREGWTYEFAVRVTIELNDWLPDEESPRSYTRSLEQVSILHILSVDADGVATVRNEIQLEETIDPSPFGSGSEALPISTIAPNGEVTVSPPPNLRANARLPNGEKVPTKYPIIPLDVNEFLGVGGTYPAQPRRPGDSWSDQAEVPFPWNDTPVTFARETRFLRYEEVDGRTAAVLSSETRGSYDVTLHLRDFLIRTGQRATEEMLPSHLDPTIRFRGSVTTYHRVWLDTARGIPLRSRVESFYAASHAHSGVPQKYLLAGEVFRRAGRLATVSELVSAAPTSTHVSG
jgi:hypothetical protein